MQIYANLFKINEKCYFSVISWPILILFTVKVEIFAGTLIFASISLQIQQARIQKPAKIFAIFCMHILDT